MRGFSVFLKKELREVLKTWRLWVLPGIALFLGITSPVLAQITPMLVEQAGQSQPGVVIEFPDPTYVDAYTQFGSQLNQLMIIAVIIATSGLISSEIRRGTAILVLTKPLSRVAFFLAKVASQTLVLLAATAVGTLAAFTLTAILFGEAPLLDLLLGAGFWFAFAWLTVAIMALLSVLFNSQGGAAGVGIALLFGVILVVSTWSAIEDYSPAALTMASMNAFRGEEYQAVIPLLSTILVGGLALAAGAWALQRKEI